VASGSASICAATNAVLDGELACLDEEGKPQFNRLLRRRGEPVFVAFDLLWLNGRDLRDRPLLDRKAALRTLIRNGGRILYADHIDGKGAGLYRAVCHSDLEGIVAKYKWGAYRPDPGSSSWIKIKNPAYSQAIGRHEQFTRFRPRRVNWLSFVERTRQRLVPV
jgi:bifunctional non-homologous end joining protein LigD